MNDQDDWDFNDLPTMTREELETIRQDTLYRWADSDDPTERLQYSARYDAVMQAMKNKGVK